MGMISQSAWIEELNFEDGHGSLSEEGFARESAMSALTREIGTTRTLNLLLVGIAKQ